MQALLLSGDQLASPHLPPSTAASGKSDAGGQSKGAQESHFFFFSPLPPPPLQMPVTSYTMRVKTAPCLPAQREGKCSVEKVTFSPVLSLPSSCLALPQGSQAGGEDAARQGGCCSGSLAHLRSVRLMRCGSSAELLTRGAARDYLWRDKAGGHQAGGQPEMSAAKSGSSLGFLEWLG